MSGSVWRERHESPNGGGTSMGGTAHPFVTIRAADVGRPTIHAFGRTWLVSGFLGRVLPGDVGKRVYLVGDVLQVENERQRAERAGRGVL